LVEDKINEIQTLATDNLIMQEAGFLEVYINNEAQTPVYYDNFTVAATTSNVTEINAYYPYGMIIPGLSLMAPPGKWNGYKYSEKELQTELGLNWGDHGARMMDYTVGRWWVPDPLAEEYYSISTYVFVGNNPIRYIDPNGINLDYYLLKKNGEIELLKKTDDKFDKLIAENGSSITVSKNKNGESVLSSMVDNSKTFNQQQTFQPEGVTVEGNYAITKSGSEAKKVFEFAAKNSTAEWVVNNYKNGDWVVGTLHEGSLAPNFVKLNSYYNMENTLYHAHSHGGTGHDVDFWPSYPWDIDFAARIKQHNPNAVVKLFMPQNPTRKWMDLPGPYDYKRKQYIYKIRSEGEQYLKSIGR
jgi:RHS repeat-associated protein